MTYEEFENEYRMLRVERTKYVRNAKKRAKVLKQTEELKAAHPEHFAKFQQTRG